MTGFVDKKLVAYSALAVSEAAFDANEVNGVLPWFLSSAVGKGAPANIIDSVCVATSEDGGQNYPAIVCVHPTTTSAPFSMSQGTDQTSVGVDTNDRVFVVTDDFGANDATGLGLRLYALFTGPFGAGFVPVAIDPQMGDAHHTPRIARDQDGELWLAAGADSGAVRLCHVTVDSCDFVGTLTTNAAPFQAITDATSSLFGLRTGLTVSFAVNRVLGSGVLHPEHHDFYFAYQDLKTSTDTGRLTIIAGECSFSQVFPFACASDALTWDTPLDGEHFQPNVSFVDAQCRSGRFATRRPIQLLRSRHERGAIGARARAAGDSAWLAIFAQRDLDARRSAACRAARDMPGTLRFLRTLLGRLLRLRVRSRPWRQRTGRARRHLLER